MRAMVKERQSVEETPTSRWKHESCFLFFPQKTPSILFNNCWYAQCVYIIQTHMAKHTSKSIGNRCSMKSLHMVEVLNTVPLPIFQFAWYAFAGGRNEFKFVYIWLNTLYHLMNVVFLSRKCWRTISSSFFLLFSKPFTLFECIDRRGSIR